MSYLSPNPFQILFLRLKMLLIGLLPPLLAVEAVHRIRYLKKGVEIKLRSQMGLDVQQLFDTLHCLKD
ncbi:hypothetical protein [Nostoc sp.]|uniref:hypothetical protein n=2 Tax=Nostoc sp. TaxID=1180 RepID=UPI002FF822AE